MQPTLKPKPADDPHDVLVVATDAVRIAPAEDEIASLLRGAARQRPEPTARTVPDVAIGAKVPAVDTTFRPSAVDDGPKTGRPRLKGRWATRGLTALVLTACIGGAAFAWQTEGDAARQMIAQWTPLLTSVLPAAKPDAPAQPAAQAVEAEATNATPQVASPQLVVPAQAAQPATPSQAAADAAASAAASAQSAQLLQSMQQNVASLTQQVEQLKASIDALKAGQQQLTRDVAKAAEQNLRPKTARLSAAPPRPAIAHPRKPMQTYYPPAPAQAASPLPPATASYPAAAPYPPRQLVPPPQAATEPQDEQELSPVPRPPMPVR